MDLSLSVVERFLRKRAPKSYGAEEKFSFLDGREQDGKEQTNKVYFLLRPLSLGIILGVFSTGRQAHRFKAETGIFT